MFSCCNIVFKEEDSSYSKVLLEHAIELYGFADQFRGDYVRTVPATAFYNSYSGYLDELAWGAMWLYKATGVEKYNNKYKEIADEEYLPHDMRKYTG